MEGHRAQLREQEPSCAVKREPLDPVKSRSVSPLNRTTTTTVLERNINSKDTFSVTKSLKFNHGRRTTNTKEVDEKTREGQMTVH